MMNIDLSKCIDTILYIVGVRENGESFTAGRTVHRWSSLVKN